MQLFSIDFREDSIGREGLGASLLYPFRSSRRLVERFIPGGYAQPDQLARLVQNLHCELQRSLTESGKWQLVVFLDQTTDSPPGWGSVAHQVRVIRNEILIPLRKQYSQQPALCLGVLVDQWRRDKVKFPGSEAEIHAPTRASAYAHWCSDVFGVLHSPPEPLSFSIDLEDGRYSHLLTESDLASLDSVLFQEDLSESHQHIHELPQDKVGRVKKSLQALLDRTRDLVEEKKRSASSLSGKNPAVSSTPPPCLDPTKYDRVLEEFENRVQTIQEGRVRDYLSFSPKDTLRKIVRRELSLHGLLTYDNDFALLRLPVQGAPVQRQRRDLLKVDYLVGGLSRITDLGDLRDRLVGNDKRAYLLGGENLTEKAPPHLSNSMMDNDTGVSVDFSILSRTAHHYQLRLESAESTLRRRRSEVGHFEVKLFEEDFRAPCTVEIPDEREDTLGDLDDIPAIRSPHSSPESIWSGWVNSVDQTIEHGYQSVRQDLTTCLANARSVWDTHTSRTVSGESIDEEIKKRKRTFEDRRRSVFKSSQGAFENNWKARSQDIREKILRVLRRRPQRRHLLWSTVALTLACLPFLVVSPGAPVSPSALFWAILVVLGVPTVYMASLRRIRKRLNRCTREAKTHAGVVFSELRDHAEGRRETIQKYFEALAAKRNLQRVQEKKREITGTRLRLDHHLKALHEHVGDAKALKALDRDFSAPSVADNVTTDVDLPNLSDPVGSCSIYSLKADTSTSPEILGIEGIEEIAGTGALPGLKYIKCREDPSYDPNAVF